MNMLSNSILSFRSIDYLIHHTPILNNVSFDVIQGDFVFFFGETGSGKTAILELIAGQTKPSKGKIQVLDTVVNQLTKDTLPYYRRKLGIVSHSFSLSPYLTIYQNLALVLEATGWKDSQQQQSRILQLLRLLKIDHTKEQKPAALDQVDYTKALLARAIINQPPLLLIDDITRSLDESATKKIIQFIKGYANDNGSTVLFFTSDKHIPHQYPADSILVCQNKEIKTLMPA